ncbi:EamA family transporter [Acinetobacter nectaris]|uniref:EamA family transporter n=1 Tax=Acinetobacter nectaris TaxID=1219382 RepID=UPI001F004930|nr:EamA family transporter [Acinetobacter nectaris]MCF8999850.1 EamA family transporter [Acinetobacter nectaris]MCF9027333.1 EamA family transporter [Acinetobacter nectaris]
MTPKDILLAIIIIFAWGFNFVIIKLGVHDIPPFLLGALRFICVAFPAILFIPRPKIPLHLIAFYGLTLCFGQFALLFLAIHLGMPAGVASLVLQSQAFFTILLSYLFLKEAIKLPQMIGMCVALLGLATLASSQYMQHTQTIIPIFPFFLVLTASFSWAMGNICNKITLKTGQTNTLSLVTWGGLFPIIPFLLCSFIFEGKAQILHSLSHFSVKDLIIVLYLSMISSLIGYSLWGYLLNKYETWKVAPLTLLVPIIGLFSAFIFLHEVLSIQQLIGTFIVIFGLCINVFGSRILQKFKAIYG